MTCFDEEPDYEYEDWIKSGGECQRCGKKESDAPVCENCQDLEDNNK